ncbi:antiviral RADAR system adenosine deaminase RdrB [Caballeronia sp. DA-9]|uniref:antiviral RADAR system adenosine deaminase RdrB n=1 Tax=Caballeronia sp. DA-9 TaxID=3436237 RepID=UPI003F67B7A4
MFKRSLEELAIGGLFSSPDVASELLKYLTGEFDIDEDTLRENCFTALEHTLEREYRRQYRRNDIERVVSGIGTFLTSPELPVLDKLFDRLMMRDGDYLQYRENQVQAFVRLASDIDPTLLAGWHIAGWLERASSPLPSDLRRIVAAQLPMFVPLPASNKPFAEGHVHLGGITFDGLLLAERLLSDSNIEEAGNRATIKRLRRVLRVLLEHSTAPAKNAGEACASSDLRAALNDAADDTFVSGKSNLHLPLDWPTFADECLLSGRVDIHWLLFQLATAVLENHVSQAWLWLVVYLWSIFRAPDAQFCQRAAVCYLLTELMQLRHQIIMDGQGLTRFARDYYPATLRKSTNVVANTSDIARRLLVGSADLAEIKIGTGTFGPDVASTFAAAVAANENITKPELPMARSQDGGPTLDPHFRPYVDLLNRWHFCAHLSRSIKAADTRHAYQQSQWIAVKALHSTLERQAGWQKEMFLRGDVNPGYTFQPARWLRGLDVAGDENVARIELFAPMLRWLRTGLPTRPECERASAGFHLSVHAGEDYAHPVSGMRHVDETVRFCEMRSGDRLGHALALGIDPAVWCGRHGDMVLPVDEHLDNLVWAWHYACELSSHLPLAGRILPRLERRIARFASEVPWLNGSIEEPLLWPRAPDNIETHDLTRSMHAMHDRRVIPSKATKCTPDKLHQAWLLRRNCAIKLHENIPVAIYDDVLEAAVPDYIALNQAWRSLDKETPESIYLAREAFYATSAAPPKKSVLVRLASRGDADLMLPFEGDSTGSSAQFLYDYDSPDDLEFMHALQDYLLQRYDQQGLILETNPTSNVYIARLNTYLEHPIFRWNPPDDKYLVAGERYNRFGLRRGPIQVLVNTDDPGIMPTTLRTEFALLLDAAIESGYSRTNVELWLERIRQAGVDQFHKNHLPVFPNA